MQARKEWQNIFKVLKEKTSKQEFNTRQGYHSEFKENFPSKQNLKEFITAKSALQQMLKGFPKTEKICNNKKTQKHLELSYGANENMKWYSHTRKEWKYLIKLNMNFYYNTSNLTFRYLPKEKHILLKLFR